MTTGKINSMRNTEENKYYKSIHLNETKYCDYIEYDKLEF